MHDTVFVLQKKLKAHQVRGWEVMYCPTSLLGFASRTPEGLRRRAPFRLIARDPGAGIVSKRNWEFYAMVRMLETTKLTPLTQAPSLDIGYGTQILLTQGEVIFSLYLDKLEDRGYINGKAVTFGPEVRWWFKAFTKRHFPLP